MNYSGDYREGYSRLAAGGQETYHSQRYSVETTATIGRKFGNVGVLCCIGNEPYDEVMTDGVRAMGDRSFGTRCSNENQANYCSDRSFSAYPPYRQRTVY